MVDFLRSRGSLAAKLALLSLVALILVPSAGCSQGGVVDGEVLYKMVNGMQDRRWFIIVRNEPADGQPTIVFDPSVETGIRDCFPPAGYLVVDNAALERIEASYDEISYTVTLHLMSGDDYMYYQACRADRETFNQLAIGTRVKVDTEPSDVGPLITSIVR